MLQACKGQEAGANTHARAWDTQGVNTTANSLHTLHTTANPSTHLHTAPTCTRTTSAAAPCAAASRSAAALACASTPIHTYTDSMHRTHHPHTTHLRPHHLGGSALCCCLQVCSRLGQRLCQPSLSSGQLLLHTLQLLLQGGHCCLHLLLQGCHCCLVLAAVCLLLLFQETNVLGGSVGALLGLVCRQGEQAGTQARQQGSGKLGSVQSECGVPCVLARLGNQSARREKTAFPPQPPLPSAPLLTQLCLKGLQPLLQPSQLLLQRPHCRLPLSNGGLCHSGGPLGSRLLSGQGGKRLLLLGLQGIE